MPTYQYVCTDCENDLEAVQTFQEPSLSICPSCGGKLRKRFGAVGVVFKGSGFYRNDSRSDRGASKSGGEKPSGEGKSESKTEAKSESKTEAKSDSSSTASTPSSGTSSSTGSSSSSSTPKATSAA